MYPHMPEQPEQEIDYNVLAHEAKYYKASDFSSWPKGELITNYRPVAVQICYKHTKQWIELGQL